MSLVVQVDNFLENSPFQINLNQKLLQYSTGNLKRFGVRIDSRNAFPLPLVSARSITILSSLDDFYVPCVVLSIWLVVLLWSCFDLA